MKSKLSLRSVLRSTGTRNMFEHISILDFESDKILESNNIVNKYRQYLRFSAGVFVSHDYCLFGARRSWLRPLF